MNRTKTTSWVPTCECGTTRTVPGVVLDPFIGSGTTAAVARRLGCNWLGIELDPGSIKLAQQRLAQGRLDLEGSA